MRVTSASASDNSLVASAASRTLYDRARSEPGMTRILGTAMTDRLSELPRSVVCRSRSISPVYPHARRRDVHPHALGRLRAHALEPLGERRYCGIGELDERR